MISIIFWGFAAFLSALMDTVDDHYSESIFYSPTDKFWNKDGTWSEHKFLGVAVPNAWHIAKALMLLCFFISMLSHTHFFYFFHDNLWNWFTQVVVYCAVWYFTFEYFYSHYFIKK